MQKHNPLSFFCICASFLFGVIVINHFMMFIFVNCYDIIGRVSLMCYNKSVAIVSYLVVSVHVFVMCEFAI